MSLILEALKKSEAKRRLGEAPDLGTPFATPRRRGSAVPLLVTAIAAAGALGWWLMRAPTAPPKPATTAAADKPAPAAANPASQPAPAPVAPRRAPVQMPAAPVASAPHAAPGQNMPAAAGIAMPSAPAQRPP